jgi:hypothetical protein
MGCRSWWLGMCPQARSLIDWLHVTNGRPVRGRQGPHTLPASL